MKSKALVKLFEICGYANDPNADFFEEIMFKGVNLQRLENWNRNKDRLVKRLLREVPKDVEVVESAKSLEKFVVQDGDSMRFRITEPILIKARKGEGGIHFEGNSFGTQRIYMGKGSTFEGVQIYSPTFIQENANIEFTSMQAERRAQFLGFGAKLSNISECRGLFVSGYQNKEDIPKDWQNTYLHAASVNNLIGGAGSDLCTGVNFMNHPEEGEEFKFVEPLSRKAIITTAKKIPILFGMNASVGAGTLIDCGTVVGQDEKLNGISRLKGLVVDGNIYQIPRVPSHNVIKL